MGGTCNIDAFFKPSGCAVIGASTNPLKAGHQILRNIKEAGFTGFIAPVSPSGDSVLGVPGFTSLANIPEEIELAVMAAPAATTPSVVADIDARMSTKKDIRALIVAAAGFGEVGTTEGKEYQRQLVACCARHHIRMLGPNCVGSVDVHAKLDTTFIADIAHVPGGISLVSQSGAVGAWMLMDWRSTAGGGVGFSKFLSVGNMADLEIIEALEYLGNDATTRVVGLYIEGSPQARKLVETAGQITRKKPVLVLKVGRTEEGAAAAASHTGSMAGKDEVYSAAFRQHGILRMHSIDELSDSLRAFDSFPLPAGPATFVLTQAGGPGIFCVDEMAARGTFTTPLVSGETRGRLCEILPPFASVCSPEGHADITAAATAAQHIDALEVLLRDPAVESVMFITTATLFLDLTNLAERMLETVGRLAGEGINKPVFPVILSGRWVKESRRILEEGGIPTFDTPNRAVAALSAMITYGAYRRRLEDAT